MYQKKILMLCLGNICRSPLAQGLLEKEVQELGLNWTVDSAGLGHWHIGKTADPRSIKIAAINGLDISQQRARRFEVTDFEKFDIIYAMDEKNLHYLNLLARTEAEKQKCQLIMEELLPGENRSVPDPFHDGEENFSAVYKALKACCHQIALTAHSKAA